jgi:hypothetical protein
MNESLLRLLIKCAILESKERIPGGLASNKSLHDIADKHGVSLSHINAQLSKGVKVEMEHTDDKKVAREIAKDHLMEDPNYYDELEKMEKGEC